MRRKQSGSRKVDAEVQRLTEGLVRLVRISGRTRQALERDLGFSSGLLSKILGGSVRLQAIHIHKILAALNFSPGSFYGWVFPGTGEAGLSLEKLPPAAEVSPADSGEPGDLDERVRRILARLLAPPQEPAARPPRSVPAAATPGAAESSRPSRRRRK